MEEIAPVEQLLDKLISAISPRLHGAASKAMDEVRWGQPSEGSTTWGQSEISEVARCWPSVVSGISVISNRASLCHTDINGLKEWYDFLLTAGTYNECVFRLPDLELELEYLPRTMVALNGRVFRHEVVGWSGGERVCYAHWVRPTVLKALSIDIPSWVTQSEYI